MAHVFFSYSHVDEELRNELEKHLAILRRQGVITTWHDRRISPGEDFHGQIDENLNAADIVLLLVSVDFLNSDYCYDIEMKRAMERHENSEAHVIRVILRPCDWQDAPFGTLLAVPKDGKPVVKHSTLDDGFLEVVKEIRTLIDSEHSSARTTIHPQITDDSDRSVSLGPRSSNLRVPYEFTGHDRHAFLTQAFEYVAQYFENSLIELQQRNDAVEPVFRRIDTNRFEARAFLGSNKHSNCGIWIGGNLDTYEIYFSFDGIGDGNSYHEVMSISDDGYMMYLQPMGLALLLSQNMDNELTMEGAAEYFWSLFVDRLR